MSLRLFHDDVLFQQRLLKSSGFYSGRLDGVWGTRTDHALSAFERASARLAQRQAELDPRTEANIRTLGIAAQEAARAFMRRLLAAGFDARIISGTRSYAEQNALFRRGRWGNRGPRVTKARGGRSMHNFAIAWDIGLFENGRYLRTARSYDEAAAAAMTDTLRWGGAWARFKDRPHYELATTLPLAEIRRRFEAGEVFV
jgi:peptidoglycan LD-endopeptidase CwlK